MMHLGRAPRLLASALLLLASACSSSSQETSDAAPAAFDSSFLDTSVEPCADFYQYACGTWVAQHQAHAGFAVERLANGDYREDIYFSHLVEAMASSDPALLSAQRYYAGCLGAEHNSSAFAPAVAGQLSLVDAMQTIEDLPSTLASLQHGGVSALLSAYPQIDPGNPSSYVLDLLDTGYSLASAKAYLDPEVQSAYLAHISALSSAASSASLNLTLNGQPIVDFESALATASGAAGDPTAVHDPVAEYNPQSLAELTTQLPSFDWTRYFQALGFRNVTRVNLISPEFLGGLASLLAATPLDTVKQYLEWRILEATGSHIDQPMFDEEFRFHRGVLEGQERDRADDTYWCLLDTRSWFGFELAQHFVQNFVASDVKPSATTLVESVRSAMHANFSEVAWLDDATRTAAQQKLDLLLPKVGYPDTWPAPRVGLAAGESYLDMLISLNQQVLASAVVRLGRSVDRSEFWASPEVTNAFYSPARNDITIPVAVLQDPFFNRERPPAYSYGALGAVIGHELTHAFDSNGRHFDGTGALTDWWTQGAASEFQARTRCLVDQYSGYEALPGSFVNGQSTLNENIADLGGVKLAYQAFEATKPTSTASTSHSQYTAEQQFFLSYAQLWCASISDRASMQQLASDPHSPPRFRVNGVVRNLPQFADAFSCSADAPLAQSDRCDIW